MAKILDKINKIRTAILGKEVRGALADGLDAVNKETENTTAKQKHLEDTFDQLVIDAGNSNAEVVDARVDKTTNKTYGKIGDRMDEVSSQLAQIDDETNTKFANINKSKLDKSGIVHMPNMGQDIKEAMTGGSVAVVGNNMILQQNIVTKQVTHDKLGDNVIKFKDVNLIIDIGDGYFINWTNGNLQASDVYSYSNYITVIGGEKLYLRANYHLAFYDSNMEFIEGKQGYPNEVLITSIVVPADAVFARFSIQTAIKNEFVVCRTDEYVRNPKKLIIKTITENSENISFEGELLKSSNFPDNEIKKNKVDELIVKCSVGKNKYYPKELGMFVNWDTGYLTQNPSLNTSDFIEVKEGDIVYQTRNAHWCVYDSSKKRIDGSRGLEESIPMTMPSNAKYIRVSPKKDEQYMLSINENISEYEEFKYIVDDINGHKVEISKGETENISRLYGKKVSWYGTSITQGYAWCNLVNNYFKFKATNNGVGGTTISKENNDSSMCTKNRMLGRYSGVVDENTGETTYEGVAIPSDVEIIFIEGGTNDWARNWVLGDEKFTDKPNDQTFYGACHLMFKNLTELFPNAEIIIVGSSFGKMPNRTSFTNKYGVLNNQNLQTIEYGDKLLEIANKWGIKGFNMGREMQIHDNNVANLIPDGLHLTTSISQKKASEAIINYLLTLN